MIIKQVLDDGFVSGIISSGNFAASVAANVSCNGSPTGAIAGTFLRVFTGGPNLEDFEFSSSSPLIVGTIRAIGFVAGVFANVTLTNTTTNEEFTGCTAVLTATRLSDNSWTGSSTVICPEGPTLTAFGTFTGDITVERDVLCQVQL